MTETAPRLSISVDFERPIGAIDRNIYGHFIEHVGRCIYGGVFEPGSPLAGPDGFRQDVLQAMRHLGVPNLRWPGGNFASSYHWKDGVGPREQRPARFDLAWRAVEPNTFGTDEFGAYCRELGAQPYICVNSSSGTLLDAAHWVEYCNLAAEKYPTANVRWREANGHPEPYGVRYWGIGNEVYGAWQVGFSGAAEYARRCREYAHFMRAVDPGVKLIAVGADIPEWDEAVLRIAGDTINYISNHQYHGQEDYHATVGAAVYVERHLRRLSQLIEDTMPRLRRTTPIQIAMDEWNVCDVAWGTSEHLPEPIEGEYFDLWEQTFALKDALLAAGVFHAMFRESRHVTFANLAQMVNANGMLQTSPDGLLLTAVYHAFDLYANHSGAEALPTRVAAREGTIPSYTAEDLRYPEPRYVGMREPILRFSYPNAPYLDAQATRSRDRRTLYLSVINYHPQDAIAASLELDPLRPLGTVAVLELNGEDTNTPNTFERPDVTRLTRRSVESPLGAYTFPPHSATVLELALG